jgi:surface carbohydrate biosynthesis protein (TIGR04326 family)
MSVESNSLLLWDSPESPLNRLPVYIWNGYKSSKQQQSLPSLLEKNSDKLKDKFLSAIHEIISEFNQKNIHTKGTTESQSFLVWMSLLIEKSRYKSSMIFKILRLLTLVEELGKNNFETVHYVGAEPSLADALKRLCAKRKLIFVWERTRRKKKNSLLRSLWATLPNTIKSMMFLLRYIWKHWQLKKVGEPTWFDSPDAVFLFSYFIHLDRKSCEAGSFYSKQWEVLPETLRKSEKPLNWMHLFLFSPVVPDTATGNRWLRKFNQNPHEQGVHAFLDTFLGWDVLCRVLWDWLRIQLCYLWLSPKIERAMYSHPQGWLWPVLRRDWHDSMTGVTAMKNLLWIHLFDKAMAAIPYQRLGLYLCENQGWERAFIHAWRKHGHGRLIGVAHSTIRYWDLRYFNAKESANLSIFCNLPQPDLIAVNGPLAWQNLKQAGQPMERYFKVEALRYLYLNEMSSQSHYSAIKEQREKEGLLLLGDFELGNTHRMLLEFKQAFPSLNDRYDFWVKPHPANRIELEQYPWLNAQLTESTLADILPQIKLVIASVFTVAELEAFCAGVSVINYLDPCDLNFSNLRGIKGAEFVSSASELIEAVERIESGDWVPGKPEDFFWLDPDLPRWKRLLALEPAETEARSVACI